jgi:hypothetical protein
MSQNDTANVTADGELWQPPAMLAKQLGFTRRTLYRKISQGLIESCTIAGRKLYRPVIAVQGGATDGDRLTDRDGTERRRTAQNDTRQDHRTAQNDTASQDVTGMPDVPPNVMALVQRYEDKLDVVRSECAELQRQRTTERAELNGQVAQLRAEVQTADHQRQLVELEAKHNAERLQSAAVQFRAVAEQRRAEADRARREAESLRQRLEALQTLDQTPWWAIGRRRQLQTVLAGAVLTEG